MTACWRIGSTSKNDVHRRNLVHSPGAAEATVAPKPWLYAERGQNTPINRAQQTGENQLMKTLVRRRKPRCKQVLAILGNRLKTVELVREEIHPQTGDFAMGPLEVVVVKYEGSEVSVPLQSVVFLGADRQWRVEAIAALDAVNAGLTRACEGMQRFHDILAGSPRKRSRVRS